MSRSNVLVCNIPKYIAKQDLLIYFQSKKKSDGGEVAEIDFDPERGEATISFKDHSVAKSVISKAKHQVNGAHLTVVADMPSRDKEEEIPDQDEPECASVLVSGFSEKTTKDAIQMYFENSRRSSGGDVRSVRLDGNQAIVTFESPDVASKVLEWGKHTLDECPLTVKRPIQPKKTPAHEEEESEQPVQRSRVVRVSGISDKTTKDALLNFFENTRRSGGGEIEDIQHIPDERLADITFCSPEDAERASEKECLELDGSRLSVTLKEIPKEIPKDPYKLHVMGISSKTTMDGLMSFMEVVSGEEVESILFGSNSNAMITFKEPPDLDKAQKKCSTRALDGSHLKIEQVNICDCIEVTKLAPNTTKDTVYYYFDNDRNGGGEVKNVEMDLEKARALVFFEEPEVVTNVTRKRHVINGATLKVVPYYPFLGEISTTPGGGKKEKVIKVDKQAMEFLKKFLHQEFDRLLQESRLKYTWQQDSEEIVLGCVDPNMEKSTWEKSCESVLSYTNQIVTEKIPVSQEALKKVIEMAKEKCAPYKDKVNIICREKDRSFTLTGKRTDVSELAEELKDLTSEIEKKIKFEKSKVSKSFDVTEAQIDLFRLIGFVEDLQARCKDLEVTMSMKDLTINFRGPDAVVKEGNVTVWKTLSMVKEQEMELPKSIVGIVVSEPGKDFMAAKFKQDNVDAVVSYDPNSETQLMVTAVDRRDLKKALDLIKDVTSEQSIPLDADQKRLLQTEKWKELKNSIQKSMLLRVTEEPAVSTLWVAGIKENIHEAKEQVQEFFEENTILEEEVETESGCVKFIFKHKSDVIQNIEKSLRSQTVKLMTKYDEGNVVVVSGTREGIKQATQEVKKLISNVKDLRVDLDMPGAKKLFSAQKGIKLLSIVENDHKCIIERCLPSTDVRPSSIEDLRGSQSLSKIICSYVTSDGKTIILYKGDLTKHRVDVIVNAANEGLKHIGGLAKSIAMNGGQEIQDECDEFVLRNGNLLDGEVFVSRPGKLPCKRLIHAVGPRWNGSGWHYKGKVKDDERKALVLGQTVYNALEEAEKFTSIAFPAISAGVFGCPADVCAKTLIESACEYLKENSNSKLTEIHFVDMNDSVIKAFHDEMTTRFGKEHSFKNGATSNTAAARKEDVGKGKRTGKGRPTRRRTSEPIKSEQATVIDAEEAGVYDDPNSFTTAQGMKIMVIVGDLAKEEAHVIVNTVASDLDLRKNPCAKALSDAAGPGLQQECKSKAANLSAGQVLVTDGYNLGCKNVFHVIAGSWENGKGESVLRSLIQSCFKETDNRGFSSIAFPAIGTGKLAFPRDVVAKVFFEESDAFKIKHPQSPLTEVHLVLFHMDKPTVKAFQDELSSRKPKQKAGGKRRSHVSKSKNLYEFDGEVLSREPLGSFVNISDEDISRSSYIGAVLLEIVPGDITKEKTDAIVTVSNPSLSVSFGGGVGAAIAKAGGPTIQKECDKLGHQKAGSVVSTSAGNLPTKRIFHLALVSSSFVYNELSDVVFDCLVKAESMKIKSIAFPAIGTGMGRKDPKDAAKALLSAIAKFSQENPVSVKHIRIVVFQDDMLKTFYNAIDDLSTSRSGMWSSLWKGFKDIFGFGETGSESYAQSRERTSEVAENPSFSTPSGVKMWLQVYAASDKDLSKAEKDITNLMKENSKTKEIEHKAIGKLSDAQREKVMRMETKYDTKIQIDKRINRIVIRGGGDDVSDATLAVYRILNKRAEEEQTRKYAELLSKNVQWYYFIEGGAEPYDDETNAKIEQAYKDDESTVVVELASDQYDEELTGYRINFRTMIETNLESRETSRVERKEKTEGIKLPDDWDAQPRDGNGKEVDVHLVPLDPTKNAKEYYEVKKAIEKSTPINIVKIERVQNPSLYQAYMLKKQKMDDKNGSNELKLFHGTSPKTCQLINHQGFDRNFCGKNAIVYGNGVYFARDAVYSMQSTYSPPDSTGNRYMYMASVLAGDYAVGQRGMLSPPARDPNNPTITYDTVVNSVSNPEIYVVFHDHQNYPDYLITFK